MTTIHINRSLMMNKLCVITIIAGVLCVISAHASEKTDGGSNSTSDKVRTVLMEAMDKFEERHPDAMSTLRYDVKPDGSTLTFRHLDRMGELGEDVMRSVKENKALFDSIEIVAKKEAPAGTVMSMNDGGYVRSIRFQEENSDDEISMNDSPEKYKQAFLLRSINDRVFEMYHYWRTGADSSYMKAADLSDLDREFYNMFENQNAMLKKVRYRDDSYFSGALRILSQEDQSVTGSMVIIPSATSKQWIKLAHLLMGHSGDKGQLSVTYSRDRSVYVVDYVNKTIYAATLRNNAMYFMKATYTGVPYLPSNWAAPLNQYQGFR